MKNMIPQLLLEQIALGEKDAKDFYSKYTKEELDKALMDLKKSNEEILRTYSLEEMQKSFVKKSLVVKEQKMTDVKVHHKTKNISFKYISMVAAAVFAFAICIPVISNALNSNYEVVIAQNGTTRVKGNGNNHHQLRLYKKNGNDVVSLKNGEKALENDVIQITYLPGPEKYGVIFSVDGNGNVTRHFPEDTWTSQQLKITGEEIPLEFSYALDDAPKYECFIFVASKNSFDLKEVENLDKSLFSVEYLKKGLYLPKDCSGTMFVLNK